MLHLRGTPYQIGRKASAIGCPYFFAYALPRSSVEVGGGMMVDLVGTCPKDFWLEWIAEGDAAGDPETGEEWGWYTMHSYRSLIKPGDRFYVVAHGMLRGWAPLLESREVRQLV